jgi:hypothetical protein
VAIKPGKVFKCPVASFSAKADKVQNISHI